MFIADSPREDTEHQVEHEEGSDDDEGDEVEPVPGVSCYIVGLDTQSHTDKSMNEKLSLYL